MSSTKGKSIHQRLLTASYVLGAFASLLGGLAAIGAAIERNDLQYPSVNGPVPVSPMANKNTESSKRYFDQ